MKILVNKFLTFFRNVKLYESNNSSGNTKNINFNLYVIKNSNKVFKNKYTAEYFRLFSNKRKRLLKGQNLFILTYKKQLACSGWMAKSNKWIITEVDLSIRTNNTIVLFDFYTPVSMRSKGYYTKLLKMILQKLCKKKLLIYTLSSNQASIKAIEKAGFIFKRNINRFNFKNEK